MALNKLFWGFRHNAKTVRVQNHLAELQKKAKKKPDNLNLQIRMADLFIKLGKKDEALEVYRQAAEKYAQKNLVSQAMALNKIILRLDPSQEAVNNVPPELGSQRMDEEKETERSVGNKERDMVDRTILLINEEGDQYWLEEKDNGSLWQGDGKIFASEIEASIKGWKVDALKIVFRSTDGKDEC